MRKVRKYVDPSPQAFSPSALQRVPAKNSQRNFSEDTVIYGDQDALPLKISQTAVRSPSTMACLETVSQFIKGSGFADRELMDIKVNKTGQTLWDLHCLLADSLAMFWGYALNFKFNDNLDMTSIFQVPFEGCRLVKPANPLSYKYEWIKYNPFFGTNEYEKKYTRTYPIWDGNKEELQDQLKDKSWIDRETKKNIYPGQVYYYGKTTPVYRIYPVPGYWSAKNWIQVDAGIQEFHDQNIENGFFQSVLINMIGDPSKPSRNPEYQKTETGTDGVKRKVSTKNIGEEFNETMSQAFSGKNKAGTAMVLWALNKDQSAKIEGFPSNLNADVFGQTLTDAIRGITIATSVPAILANLPQQDSSLGSDGKSMQVAIELMQSRVIEWQNNLMALYNNVILPALIIDGKRFSGRKVQIINFVPVTIPVEIEDKFWNVLNDTEKRNFIKKNMPSIEMEELLVTQTTELLPTEETGNDALKSLNIMQINRLQKIVSRYNLGKTDPSNTKALTHEQAKQFLQGYGFTEEQIIAWLDDDTDPI